MPGMPETAREREVSRAKEAVPLAGANPLQDVALSGPGTYSEPAKACGVRVLQSRSEDPPARFRR